jgi:hypothetical protein
MKHFPILHRKKGFTKMISVRTPESAEYARTHLSSPGAILRALLNPE